MAFDPFKFLFPKKMVGVDIGTSSLKIVELFKFGKGITLQNYGEIKSISFLKESFRQDEKGGFLLSSGLVSKAMRAVLDEARIKTKAAVFSIPDFSTFFVSFELPPMSSKEIPEAVRLNAPQYVPLPMSETTLDWRLISGVPGDKRSSLNVLVIAVANQVVQEYQRAAKSAGLELYALEAEALAAVRCLIKNDKKPSFMIDIGAQSTTVNVVDKGILEKSYSFDFSSNQLTYAVSSATDKIYPEAEQVKRREGLISKDKNVSDALYLIIDPFLAELNKIVSEFSQQEGKDIEKIYLTGGTANLPGLKEYFAEVVAKKIEIPNCFADFIYPPILGDELKEMSPSYSVAVGVALGGMEAR